MKMNICNSKLKYALKRGALFCHIAHALFGTQKAIFSKSKYHSL